MADSGNVRTGRDLRDHLVNFLYFTDKKLITITAVIIGVNSFKHLNILSTLQILVVFPGGSDGKESACYAGDLGSILGLGRSSGEGNGKLLQYSCLENPTAGGARQATVHGVTKSWTRLSN